MGFWRRKKPIETTVQTPAPEGGVLTDVDIRKMEGLQSVGATYPVRQADLAPARNPFERHVVVAATDLSRMQSDIGALVRRLEEQASNTAALNQALGQFREQLVVPLREELKAMRYNMGAKVEQTTTELSVITLHLDKALTAMLQAAGWSKEKIDAYKVECGLDSLQAPRAAEFNAYGEQVEQWKQKVQELTAACEQLREAHQAVSKQCETLTSQNARLIREIEELRKQKVKRRGR